MAKVTFKAEAKDGKVYEFAVIKPTPAQYQKAQVEYNKSFSEAIKNKAPLRLTISNMLREQNLWDDVKEANVKKIATEIRENERKLKAGGISLKKGKEIALKTRKLRAQLLEESSAQMEYDKNTAESLAENTRFDYLMTVCLVYNDDGRPYYDSYEDYLNSSGDDEATLQGARNFASIFYNYDKDGDKKLPENKFLLDYKFVDDKLRLVDGKGRLVSESGKLINEDGRYINEEGELIDSSGNRVDESGEQIVEFSPFLDESNNPVEPVTV